MTELTDPGKSNLNSESGDSLYIRETDLVSGKRYLSLIDDFKKHEANLKAIISNLRSQIVSQRRLIKSMGNKEPELKYRVRVEHFQQLHAENLNTIRRLKIENQKLFTENILLKQQLKKFNQ